MASSGSGTHAFARHRLIYEWNIATQSIPNNTSTVTCKIFLQSIDQYGAMYAPAVNSGYLIVNGERKNYTATSDLSAYQKKLLFAANWVIGHNADGTKDFKVTANYNVNVTFNGVYYGSTTWEGFGTLNTIPRTSSVSISPATINFGDKTRIHINRASGSFTHTLTFQWYGNNNTFASKINYVDYDFTPSIDLSRYIPNGTSGWGTIVCDTYSGGTKIGSSSAKLTINTVNDSRFQPVINGFTIAEANPAVTTAVGAVYVQSKSKLKVDTNASSKMYSTISKIETKVGNATYVGSSITSGFVAESGNLNIVVTVTDSRGYKATSSKTINLAPYSNPTTKISALRRTDAQEIVDITWSGTSKAIGVDNTMGYKIEYQVTNGSWILIESDSSATKEAWSGKVTKDAIDIDKVYNIKITMYDEFMSVTSTSVIPVAKVPMSWGTTGVSVGKVFEEGKEAFQLSGEMTIDGVKLRDIFYPVGTIYESTSSTNPANFIGGSWERYGDGRVTVGLAEGDGNFDSAGKTGGEKFHTLSKGEIPNIGGSIQFHGAGAGLGTVVSGVSGVFSSSQTQNNYHTNASTKGAWSAGTVGFNAGYGGGSHNNLQPYITVYRFRRTS